MIDTIRRTVKQKDIETVKSIISNTKVFTQEEVDVAAELVESTLTKKDDYKFIFFEKNKKTLGYACYGKIPLTQSSFDLYWIAVLPEYQKNKTASKLLKEVIADIKKIGGTIIYAETSATEEYDAARKFYLNNNFKEEARLKDFYWPGNDKIIYSKQLLTEEKY